MAQVAQVAQVAPVQQRKHRMSIASCSVDGEVSEVGFDYLQRSRPTNMNDGGNDQPKQSDSSGFTNEHPSEQPTENAQNTQTAQTDNMANLVDSIASSSSNDQQTDQQPLENARSDDNGPVIKWGSQGRSVAFDPSKRSKSLPFSMYVRRRSVCIMTTIEENEEFK